MSDRIEEAQLDHLEIVSDFLDCDAVQHVFLGELLERKTDLIESLIEQDCDKVRGKIQMIDELIDLRREIGAELKARKARGESDVDNPMS